MFLMSRFCSYVLLIINIQKYQYDAAFLMDKLHLVLFLTCTIITVI